MELGIGRYPIPIPTTKELSQIFNVKEDTLSFPKEHKPPSRSPSSKMRPPGLSPGIGSDQGAGGPMAIFELLDYIVNEVRNFIYKFYVHKFCIENWK